MINFINGNQSVVKAALKAECNFFAGYPITPATSILIDMLKELPYRGGVGIQAEDEIASMGIGIAASMAGKKVLTATSGPGISLYSENIGLAIMGEVPMVIVNCQRLGPATGSATKDASGDVQFIRWSTSGGFPIIALCPTTVEETYSLTVEAFNLSERLRTPVFIMLSKELGLTCERVDFSKIDLPPLATRNSFTKGEEYHAYDIKEKTEIPKFAPFGSKNIVKFTTSSHGKDGVLTTDTKTISFMLDHLNEKINSANISMVKKDFDNGADTLIISYGIVDRSVKEAVKKMRQAGKKISHMTIYSLWPSPEQEIKEALSKVKNVFVPEMNHGQYVQEIERLKLPDNKIHLIKKVNTTLISPNEIIDAIK